jgi:hypothetical protein
MRPNTAVAQPTPKRVADFVGGESEDDQGGNSEEGEPELGL